MAYNIPNGSRVYIASKYGDEVKFSSASNAEEVVLTVEAAAGISKSDIVHVGSGWKKASGAYRVKAVTEKSITLEGLDTTDKNTFPAGGGAGSLKKVLSWEVMPQVMTISTEGGEQQTQEVQFLEDEQAETIDTYKNGVVQVYTFAHDAKQSIRKLLMKLDDSKQITAIRFYNKRAAEDRYYTASVSFQRVPNTAMNEVENVTARLSLKSDVQIYTNAE
ncbi:phage tail protein [Xenorhabdus bovienii]|uniref:Phage tail protein n=3 Tax=Xenorhabdus bovienii TaxID=40576 RepID=A0AAJ1J9W3_XENBV|nr:phage tail protein [Xenorhabdus bovienii]MDE1479684.1 phage tail protein [Xenorhabdus bovienii]MDE9495605.1 phage tail protein [Xenorhabdus bovienii]MDE9504022.1 phage tail protein [Xenorhabdus bovienii]MDE9511486.1 phage tail protein [Xenorhabdus bovienii]MDE9523201.1 phage tail protein [Xenorhabdus bovienii]